MNISKYCSPDTTGHVNSQQFWQCGQDQRNLKPIPSVEIGVPPPTEEVLANDSFWKRKSQRSLRV